MQYLFEYTYPLTKVWIGSVDDKINYVTFEKPNIEHIIKETDVIKKCHKELMEYFNKKRKTFTVNLDINGTEYQKQVYNELLKIPYGEVKTYKDIAFSINNPKSVRAVGNANNKNKIAIIIPCHRVIGANNKLIGYAGGLTLKEELLKLENDN